MGILGSLVRATLGRPRQMRPNATAAKLTNGAPTTELLSAIARLSESGRYKEAFKILHGASPMPLSSHQAFEWMRGAVAPILSACLHADDTATACTLEDYAYAQFVKLFEYPTHHEQCFGIFDSAMHTLGIRRRRTSRLARTAPRGGKLLFFLHVLSADLAHTNLLLEVLEVALRENILSPAEIAFAGSGEESIAPRLAQFVQAHGIVVNATPTRQDSGRAYERAASLVEEGEYSRVVVVSTPVGLSYLSGRLDAERLVWYVMKFELSAFAHLKHRCSFLGSSKARASDQAWDGWHRAPAFMSSPSVISVAAGQSEISRRLSSSGRSFYTINREEKIRNPAFLRVVASILDRVPRAIFVWTGRRELADVKDFFEARGVTDRVVFAGWVNPDDLLSSDAIFLDTPILSGMVAAKAAACGRALVTFAEARSWIGVFRRVYESDKAAGAVPDPIRRSMTWLAESGADFECANDEAYVNLAVRLALDPTFRQRYADTLGAFASHYFYDSRRWVSDHVENLRA
jgi:glycosyltransferase involved in cell wall biosynthesis